MRVFKNNQYGNSRIFKGNRKSILKQLRTEARELRRNSRLINKLPDNVHSINEELHQSKLVTMASFDLENKGLEELLNLLSNHGVCKYVLEK